MSTETRTRGRQPLPPPSARERKRLEKLYVIEGLTVSEVARELGTTTRRAQAMLVRAGIRLRKRGPRPLPAPTERERRRLQQMYVTEGLTVAEVARRLGISRDRAENMLVRAHIPVRRYGRTELPTPDELARLYIEEKLSTRALAARFGVHQATVWRALAEAGIPRRGPGSGNRARWPERITPDDLEELYVEQRLSIAEIARRLGVGPDSVSKGLRAYGIPVDRGRSKRRCPSRDELVELYVHQGLSTAELATRFGVHRRTPWHWLDDTGIRARRPSAGWGSGAGAREACPRRPDSRFTEGPAAHSRPSGGCPRCGSQDGESLGPGGSYDRPADRRGPPPLRRLRRGRTRGPAPGTNWLRGGATQSRSVPETAKHPGRAKPLLSATFHRTSSPGARLTAVAKIVEPFAEPPWYQDCMADIERFVLGLDLDGTCADFYGRMREIAAEWTGTDIGQLSTDPVWGLGNWGIPTTDEYRRLHRFAVTQRNLFESMAPIEGAPQAIRRLGTEGVRIRIITHRLFIRFFHETAVAQTVRWLDYHGIPYWDLCFMREKGEVGADLYVEDSPENIRDLRGRQKDVLILSNNTNLDVPDEPGGRAQNWGVAEELIRDRYYRWLDGRGLERPPGVGFEPEWSKEGAWPAV